MAELNILDELIKQKLINGDSLDVLKQIPSNSIDLVLTDPPYGINYSNRRRNKDGRIQTENGILNDNKDNLQFLKKY